METSLVVMIVPLLLTTMMGELLLLLLGKVEVEGLGRILLGCICCVMILTPENNHTSDRTQLASLEKHF